MHHPRRILAALLACMLLVGSSAPLPARAQTELTPREKEVLEQMEQEQEAEQITSGSYSSSGQWVAALVQIGVLLGSIALGGYILWKASRTVRSLLSPRSTVREKRRWERIQIQAETALAFLGFGGAHAEIRARVRNISKAGVCLEIADCPDQIQPGQSLNLSLQVKNQARVSLSELTGTVRWMHNNTIGVQFTNLMQLNSEALESLFHPSETSIRGAQA